MSNHHSSQTALHHQPPPSSPRATTFESYDPAQDAEALEERDIDTAHNNRQHLKDISDRICTDREHLKQADQLALVNWTTGIWKALHTPADDDWNFYYGKNWEKIRAKFSAIQRGEISMWRKKHEPTLIVKEGRVVEEFDPERLIKGLKLKSIFDGREAELQTKLDEIISFVRFDFINVELQKFWFDPIFKAITHDNNSRNLIGNDRWRTVVVVLQKLEDLVVADRAARGPEPKDAALFLQKYSYKAVLRKMNLLAPSRTPSVAASLQHARKCMSSRQRTIYEVDSDSENREF